MNLLYPSQISRMLLLSNHNNLKYKQSSFTSWPDSWIGKALHRHRRAQGLNTRSGLSRCCLNRAKTLRWSNLFIPIRSSIKWKIPVLLWIIISTVIVEVDNSKKKHKNSICKQIFPLFPVSMKKRNFEAHRLLMCFLTVNKGESF